MLRVGKQRGRKTLSECVRERECAINEWSLHHYYRSYSWLFNTKLLNIAWLSSWGELLPFKQIWFTIGQSGYKSGEKKKKKCCIKWGTWSTSVDQKIPQQCCLIKVIKKIQFLFPPDIYSDSLGNMLYRQYGLDLFSRKKIINLYKSLKQEAT